MNTEQARDEAAMAAWPGGIEDRDRAGTVLGRWLPLALGLLAFELSANPMLGIAVACIKFGWEDFRTALWLRRTDPERSRGWACAWFHLALGFGKIAVMGILGMVLVVGSAISWTEIAGKPLPKGLMEQEAKGALWMALGSGLLAFLTSYFAIGAGLVGGVRVWIGPEVQRSRRTGRWPPGPSDSGIVRRNPAVIVPHFAMLLTFSGLLFTVIAATSHLGKLSEAVTTALSVGVIAAVIFFCCLAQWLDSRIVADHPFECWPEAHAGDDSIERPCR